MKRILSLLLSLVMAMGTFTCFAATASAATKTVDITIKGTEYNSIVDDAIASINEDRAMDGNSTLKIDKKLTAVANKRAKEAMLYYDLLTLPNGATIKKYIPDYTGSTYAIYGVIMTKKPTKDTLESKLHALVNDNSFRYGKSVGIGVFGTKGYDNEYVYTVYVIASGKDSTDVQKKFKDKNTSTKIPVSTDKIEIFLDTTKTDNKHGRIKYTTVAYFEKGVIMFYNVSDQFTVSSSNNKALKEKGGWLYIKGNGKYKLYAQSKNTKSYKVTVLSDKISSVNTKKHTVKAKSTKKKAVKVTWKQIYKDITAYEVQYSTSNKFSKKATKTVVVKGKGNTSKTISKLKSKKTYYVRVRAYTDQTNNEKLYTPWSKTVKVKVK
ncbi:MAG: fibronectin type III domain-containing protein [Oscillospiraceae bacterium]|nr:fibronectin type III domain-containing protein [Oscillospiraceae bacterium]